MMEAAAQRPLVEKRRGALGAYLLFGSLCAGAFALYDVRLGLAAAATLVLVTLLAARVGLAVVALVAVAPLDHAFRIADSEFLTLSKAAGVVLLVSFAAHLLRTRQALRFDVSHLALLLFLLVALVSSIQAHDVMAGLAAALRYGSYAALYFIVTQFVGDHLLHRRIAWTVSLSSTVAALLALERYFSNDLQAAALRYGIAPDLAFELAAALPFAFWLLRSRTLGRFFALLMVVVLSATIPLTFNRGALLGLGAGFLWVLFVERRHVGVIVAASVAGLIVVLIMVQADPDRFEGTLQAKLKVAGENIDIRLDAYEVAVRLASTHPLGVGPGNFRFYYAQETGRAAGTELVVHNTFLDIAVELGWLALPLFLFYLWLSFARLGHANRLGKGPPDFAMAVRVALVIAVVSAMSLSQQYSMPFWLFGGLATAMWAEGRDERLERDRSPASSG